MSYKIYYNLEGGTESQEFFREKNKDEVILQLMRLLAQHEPDVLTVVWNDGTYSHQGTNPMIDEIMGEFE